MIVRLIDEEILDKLKLDAISTVAKKQWHCIVWTLCFIFQSILSIRIFDFRAGFRMDPHEFIF